MMNRLASIAVVVLLSAACGDAAGLDDSSSDSTGPADGSTSTTDVQTAAPATPDVVANESPPPPVEDTRPGTTVPAPPDVEELTSGAMQIIVLATPETVDEIVPSVQLGGIDVFGTNCQREVVSYVLSEAVYQCTDLEFAVYDVTAPPVASVQPALTCWPVGSFVDWDPMVADVGVDGFVYCTLAVYPPGVRISLFGVDAAAVTSVEIRDGAGSIFDAGCRRVEADGAGSPADVAELQCDPMPLGRYEIPRQDVDGRGVEQPFVCLPGLGAGNAPGYDNTFELDDRQDEFGADQSVWTCTNEEPIGELTGLLMLAVDADPAIADELVVQVFRDGADIFGDACRSAVAPLYLDTGSDGFRFYECHGEWWGELTPAIANVPDGVGVTVFCFEQNPVTGVMGPTAVLDPAVPEPWICSLDVGQPGTG